MPRAFRVLATLLPVVLASALLSACGGGSTSATDLLKETFGPNKPVRSGKLKLDLLFDATGLKTLKGPVSLKLNGPFASVGKGKLPKFDFALDVNAGTSFAAGAISTGDKGFVKFGGQAYAVSTQLFTQFKNGYEQAAKRSGGKSSTPSFASLGVDPRNWLTNAKNAGTEKVGGVDAYHITAGIDVGRFLTDVDKLLRKAGSLGQGQVPTSLSAQQRRDIEQSVKTTRLEVWTGKDDKTLRQLKIAIGFDVPANVRSRVGGLQRGTLRFDLLIDNLNQDQTIAAPASSRPLTDLTQALGGGAGSAGSGGTTTTPTAPPTTTTPAPSAGSSKYLTCLQKAGSDVAAVQKCAALTGQ